MSILRNIKFLWRLKRVIASSSVHAADRWRPLPFRGGWPRFASAQKVRSGFRTSRCANSAAGWGLLKSCEMRQTPPASHRSAPSIRSRLMATSTSMRMSATADMRKGGRRLHRRHASSCHIASADVIARTPDLLRGRNNPRTGAAIVERFAAGLLRSARNRCHSRSLLRSRVFPTSPFPMLTSQTCEVSQHRE